MGAGVYPWSPICVLWRGLWEVGGRSRGESCRLKEAKRLGPAKVNLGCLGLGAGLSCPKGMGTVLGEWNRHPSHPICQSLGSLD